MAWTRLKEKLIGPDGNGVGEEAFLSELCPGCLLYLAYGDDPGI